MGEKSDPGWKKFGSGMEKSGSEMEKTGTRNGKLRIRDKHPGSAAQVSQK